MVVLVVLAALVDLVRLVFHHDFAGHTWLAEWIAGVGQAVGALGTLAAVWYAVTVEKRAESRRRREADREALAHARLVTVHSDPGYGAEPVAPMAIRNNTSESILIAGIADVQPRPEGSSVGGSLELDGSPGSRPVAGVIRPLDEALFDVHCLNADGVQVPWPEGRRQVTIEFMDAHGKCWRRVNYREPERIDQVRWEHR